MEYEMQWKYMMSAEFSLKKSCKNSGYVVAGKVLWQ